MQLQSTYERCWYPNKTQEGLRSSNARRLCKVPRTNKCTFADRSFSVWGLQLWNELPEMLCVALDLQTFKKELKTYLFRQAYEL